MRIGSGREYRGRLHGRKPMMHVYERGSGQAIGFAGVDDRPAQWENL